MQEANNKLEEQNHLCSLTQVVPTFGLSNFDGFYRRALGLERDTISQRLLRRGILIMFLLLLAAIVPLLFSLPYFSITLLLVALAALQMFARVFWIETNVQVINPFVLPYTTVLTLLLAILSFAIQIYLLTLPSP